MDAPRAGDQRGGRALMTAKLEWLAEPEPVTVADGVVASPATARGVRLTARPILMLAAMALVAFNLRTPTASVPPLLGEIQRSLGLSAPALGLLTAIPVLCMAMFAPLGQRLAERHGAERVTLWAVGLVGAGALLRLGGQAAGALFVGTLIAGVGIAICGVTLPGVVKTRFAQRPGAATAAYSVPMMLGAGVAPMLAVPLARSLGSWQASLAGWAVPALLGMAVWAPLARATRHRPAEPSAGRGLPWRSRSAWLLAGFLAVQSVLAYAYLAWLAPAFQSRGWSAGATGALLGVLQLAQLVTALVLPALADLSKSRDRRPALVGAVSCTVVGASMLCAAPDAAPWVATVVLGLGLGGGFSLALVVLADFAASGAAASRLAAMTFSVCYSAAAIAPVALGAVREATGTYTVAFALLVVLASVELAIATRLRPALGGSIR